MAKSGLDGVAHQDRNQKTAEVAGTSRRKPRPVSADGHPRRELVLELPGAVAHLPSAYGLNTATCRFPPDSR